MSLALLSLAALVQVQSAPLPDSEPEAEGTVVEPSPEGSEAQTEDSQEGPDLSPSQQGRLARFNGNFFQLYGFTNQINGNMEAIAGNQLNFRGNLLEFLGNGTCSTTFLGSLVLYYLELSLITFSHQT